jgi:phytanoyl-CoA hydroxylase
MFEQSKHLHRSNYGGLWTDRIDALELLGHRVTNGQINQDEEYLLRQWIANGYVILEGAVDQTLCSELARELATIFERGSDTALYQEPESPPGIAKTVSPGLPPERMRLLDLYGVSGLAADVLTAPAITNFLRSIFDDAPLCFQGLTFEQGSGQGLHQDTAYVVIDKPLELAAAWVALEDVQEGSGELMYVNGSHRLPDWNFGGNSKHWDPTLHGQDSHTDWTKWLIRKSEELGLEKKIFRPKKGDVLIWSADLVHGGSPVGNRNLSRRSMVGHYCPVERVPHYFNYLPNQSAKIPYKDGFFSSSYYKLSDATFEKNEKKNGKFRRLISRR